ncbi:MAG: nitrate reductase molybdenum cofactor assembly chaperone [SAR202 cluster bacterium]|nr:nitrate reductase molybdenum cofactor assembly chaperone [SAR202 cluster bacterium]MDP6663440.1 nitrate reductase molybdenum cofactor assembly chaperone [SAR202 cluster bacterium]MDP6800081.1 nitrate reductase molybdenum cofactor assembly chaperone [SAR202 cluster bacterium]
MIDDAGRRRVLHLFADILDYPTQGLGEQVDECMALVSARNPEAAERLGRFQEYVGENTSGQMEEVYSTTFDLDPVCHPYVGYHIFGETYQRSAFLVGLKEQYRTCDFEVDGTELPDRISAVLRFLSISQDAEQYDVIVNEAMLPALAKMTRDVEPTEEEIEDEQPLTVEPVYKDTLHALRMLLEPATVPMIAQQGVGDSIGGASDA